MPVFQNAVYHPDETPRRCLTVDDAIFLLELQKELNTQDAMGNAAPRFWVIAQPREWPTDPDRADYFTLADPDGETVARNLKDLCEYVNSSNLPGAASATWFGPAGNPSSITVTLDDGKKINDTSLAAVGQALADAGIDHLSVVPVTLEENHVIPDTLFLTHRACEEHLKRYAYRYHPEAHAYAMTAVQSPEVQQLLELLQSVDWGKLRIGAQPGQ